MFDDFRPGRPPRRRPDGPDFPPRGPGFPPGGPGGPGFPPGGPGGPGFPPGGPGGPGFPPGGPGGPGGPPLAPPPSFTPEYAPFRVDPGSIRNCVRRYTYIWLNNGNSFWFYPVFVGRTSISGYRWIGFWWVYFGTDLRNISSFYCF